MLHEFKIETDGFSNVVLCLTQTWLDDITADFKICSQFFLYFEVIEFKMSELMKVGICSLYRVCIRHRLLVCLFVPKVL